MNATPFQLAKAHQTALTDAVNAARDTLKAIPGIGSGPMGLTPDSVRALPEYRAAKRASNAAFAELRAFNGQFVKAFKAELLAERRERDVARVARAAIA